MRDKKECKYYEVVTQIEFEQIGETAWGEPIGYPTEVPIYGFCHHDNDYADCGKCKDFNDSFCS